MSRLPGWLQIDLVLVIVLCNKWKDIIIAIKLYFKMPASLLTFSNNKLIWGYSYFFGYLKTKYSNIRYIYLK